MITELSNLGYKILRNVENEKKCFKELSIYSKEKNGVKYSFQKPKPVICYRKSKNFIYVPRYYGIQNFGIPKKIKEIDIIHINLDFNGKIRDYQKDVINEIMENFNNPLLQGGILSLGTGLGN